MLNIKTDRVEIVKKMICGCGECLDIEKYIGDLEKLGQELKGNSTISNLPNFATALAYKERLIILNALKNKDRCVCELEAIISKSQSTISHHLRKLETVGLIRGWKKGNYTYYHLEKERLKAHLTVLNEFFDGFQL